MLMRPTRPISLLLAVTIAMLGTSRGDIMIDGYMDADNDRFTNSGSFIMSGLDVSGVGQTSSSRWATAISRNVIISASHFAPSGVVTFYPGNDPTATPVTRTITSGTTIANTDIYLGVLDSNLPNSITHYDIASTPLFGAPDNTIQDAGIFQDLTAFLFGISPYDVDPDPSRSAVNDQAVGQNKIAGYVEDADVLGNTDNDALVFFQDDMPPDEVDYEAQYASNDSGAPAFLNQGGNLLLLGTAAFTFTFPPEIGLPPGSAINYTGNQVAAINSFINASAVPEPSAFLLAAIAGIPLFRRHRRKNQLASETPQVSTQ